MSKKSPAVSSSAAMCIRVLLGIRKAIYLSLSNFLFLAVLCVNNRNECNPRLFLVFFIPIPHTKLVKKGMYYLNMGKIPMCHKAMSICSVRLGFPTLDYSNDKAGTNIRLLLKGSYKDYGVCCIIQATGNWRFVFSLESQEKSLQKSCKTRLGESSCLNHSF